MRTARQMTKDEILIHNACSVMMEGFLWVVVEENGDESDGWYADDEEEALAVSGDE